MCSCRIRRPTCFLFSNFYSFEFIHIRCIMCCVSCEYVYIFMIMTLREYMALFAHKGLGKRFLVSSRHTHTRPTSAFYWLFHKMHTTHGRLKWAKEKGGKMERERGVRLKQRHISVWANVGTEHTNENEICYRWRSNTMSNVQWIYSWIFKHRTHRLCCQLETFRTNCGWNAMAANTKTKSYATTLRTTLLTLCVCIYK